LLPLFRTLGHVAVFVQNQYLVAAESLASFPFKTRLSLGLEGAWSSLWHGNAAAFLAQTSIMRRLLAAGGGPTLKLIVDRIAFLALCEWGAQVSKHGLLIESLGVVSHDRVKELYAKAAALIYPLSLESFGLALIEARQAGLPVLAPELDYVHDILDPESAISIARAVKRFMGASEDALQLKGAADFLDYVLRGAA
jgi:glycosyltransferase involved in cell wall biosynthesis